MAALLIPFPEARVFRSHKLISTLRCIENCERMLLSGDPLEMSIARNALPMLEGDLADLGGVPARLLQRDGLN